MKNVDKIIHVEVNKLYPDAILPSMSYEEPSSNEPVILYRSPRKLCALAVGFTKGAANHFNVPITIQHAQFMHKGSDHCRLEVTIEIYDASTAMTFKKEVGLPGVVFDTGSPHEQFRRKSGDFKPIEGTYQ